MGEYREDLAKQLRGMSHHVCVNRAVIGNNCNHSADGETSVSEPQGIRDSSKKKN